MLEGHVKIHKLVEDERVKTYEFKNMILRRAKNPSFGSTTAIGGSSSNRLYIEVLTYNVAISDSDYRDIYYLSYGEDLPPGYRIAYTTSRNGWVNEYDGYGNHIIVTTSTIAGPYDLHAIALRWKHSSCIALLRLSSPINFSEIDSYVIQYRVTMRW